MPEPTTSTTPTAAATLTAPPAPAPAPSAAPVLTAPPAPAPPAPVPAWQEGLDDVTRGYLQNKNWSTPADVINAYRGAEKFISAPVSQRLVVPGPDAKPEDFATFYNQLGRPAEAAGYKIEVPAEVGDPEFAKGAAGKFHELGLTKDQGEKLASWWNEQVGGKVALSKTEAANRLVKEQGELATEWGAAYTQSTAQAQAAVRALGLNAETITQLESVLGFKATMNLFQKVGSKTGEAAFVGGDGPAPLGSALTPEGAQARIQELKVDKGFQAKLKGKDVNALAEWSRLFTFAYPEPVK